MKKIKLLKYALAAFVVALGLSACDKPFDEITSLDLNRCLEPMNLNARVNSALGDVVTFSWDVSKDAESYIFTVYTDANMTQTYLTETVSPSNVPYIKKLDADRTYYFTVQATSGRKQSSKVAAYDHAIKTYAVKDNLYLTVQERYVDGALLVWSTDVEDYLDVTHVTVSLPGSDDPVKTIELTAGDKETASLLVDGLSATTEYVFTLWYLSASRGQVTAWTRADTENFTQVRTLDELLNAVKTPGAKIALQMDGSPYDIESLDITNGFTIVGVSSADGSKPVIQGEFHISDAWASGNELYFEDVEFNGGPTATAPSGFGFAIQNKNGGTVKGKDIGNLTYKNCVITNYTKGLIYEWGNDMKLGDVTYESCEISNINYDGTVGGDVFDIRQATTVSKLAFIDNTVYQGMRTFVRFDAGSVGELVFENNTLHNLNFVDNANNAGVFGLQITPGSFSFKNNLIVNMTGKAVLAGSNAKYVPASSMGVAASNNWFYNLPKGDDGSITYFTDNFTLADASGTILEADPCYNAPAGLFNILPDSEIAGKEVGASKWWTPYVEAPEDLTLNVIEGNHTWNFANAKFFSGTIKKQMVRDQLFINTTDGFPILVDGGMLNFQAAAVTDRKGVPVNNVLQFKVNQPGSVVIKAQDPDAKGNHFVVGVGPVAGGEIALKGGVSAMADSDTPTKILITSITEESMVYIYPSGPISLEKLAWSTDVTPINTALPTPEPKADPASITQGDAADITISWDPVDNAGSYSVVFNGKTSVVNEGTEFVIGGTTTGMLDAGSYKVEVFANPGPEDIYNTESAAGVATFAVLPKGGGGGDDEFVVKDVTELLAAIDAGKAAITLAPGLYDLGGSLTVTAPLALKGQDGAVVMGGFKLSGEVGSFSINNLTVEANGADIFVNLDNEAGVKADELSIRNTVIDGFTKSVIYASNTADMFEIRDIVFDNILVRNHGSGQGVFDLRNGAYGTFTLKESTVTGGRDFLRIDAPCSIYSVLVTKNTLDNLNNSGNAGGVFCVRATPSKYEVSNNIVANVTNSISGRTAAMKPKMIRNVWYNIGETFYTGCIDAELALDGQGVNLSADPFKDAATGDYTLTNAVVMSLGSGASRWNPAIATVDDSNSFTVSSVEEFTAALEAGKTDIRFEAGEYDLSASAITLGAGMHLSSDGSAIVKVSQFNLAEGELGTIVIEGIRFEGDGSNNFISVSGASVVRNLTVRNCWIEHIGKSVFYGNAEGSAFDALVFEDTYMGELGGGQGTIDIRKGAYGVVTIENCTVVGGRDFIRADAGKVTGAVNIVNNTFDGVTLNNGNGILYVRSTPESYVFKNNLFLNENGDNNKLSKDSGITVPNEVASNFFYNCVAEAFWTGLINLEVALANGGVILAKDPVEDASVHNYILVNPLCLASNVGAGMWNVNKGKISSEITVNDVLELVNALDAGKQGITLNAGTYDLREAAEGGVINLINPVSLMGKGQVVIVGGFKLGLGTGAFMADDIIFDGAEKAMGNALEIAEATELSLIRITGCEFRAYNKSLLYGNGADSQVKVFEFRKNLVHGFGTGQGMLDIRKGVYGSIDVSFNTFYDGGRDFIRCDKEIAGSIAITRNTFGACSIDAGNGLLWIRSCAANPEDYVVSKNLFVNLTGENTILAKSGATVPTMSENYFFNVGEAFFTGAIDATVATTDGGVLEGDPCVNSAEFNFRLVSESLRRADIGDPRWNPGSSAYYQVKPQNGLKTR